MKIKICAALFFLVLITAFPAYAVTVGLMYGSSAPAQLEVASGDGLMCGETALSAAVTVKNENGVINIYDKETGNMLDCGSPLEIKAGGNIFKLNDVRYRGSIILSVDGAGIRAVNNVDVDDYVCGVVPKEVSASWNPEALKAQAVISRTLLYSSFMGKHDGFDVCATANCQVYGGYDVETKNTNAAVEATKGLVVKYNGKPAQTYFSAGNGGYTADSSDVWTAALPYLTERPDPYEKWNEIKGLSWYANVTKDEIKAAVQKYGKDIGEIKNVKVTATSPAGRVTELTVTGTLGEYKFKKNAASYALGLRSQFYTLSGGDSVHTTDGTADGNIYALDSDGTAKAANSYALDTSGVVKIETGTGVYTFSGRGYGHGVGLSQWGAYEMADEGFTYDKILEFYYPGTVLEKI